MRVAIVYDRVNKFGGAERVILALHKIFPKAVLFTSVYDESKAAWAKVFPKIYTSFLQSIPILRSHHEFLGTLMPLAFETFDFSDYDLVISLTSEAAKGIITKPSTRHICYMLTPTRYLWSHHDSYFRNPLLKFVSSPAVSYLRAWDKIASRRPDKIIAISSTVKSRVRKYYGLKSDVIYPPGGFKVSKKAKAQDYFLLVSRLDFGYKSVDLAIDTFNKLNKKLLIVGSGRQKGSLESKAGSNIKFVGWVSDRRLNDYLLGAKALVMPQEEDFGIIAIEAQSLGVPVIAYGKGGAVESVVDGKTGILFNSQTIESLASAVKRFEKMKFVVDNLYTNAQKFSFENFQRKIKGVI